MTEESATRRPLSQTASLASTPSADDSAGSRTSKSHRLAARLQQRLNRQRQSQQRLSAVSTAPLSPKSEPGGGSLRVKPSRSGDGAPTSPRSAYHSPSHRNYGDRVNSLLKARGKSDEEDDETGPLQLQTKRSGIIANLSAAERGSIEGMSYDDDLRGKADDSSDHGSTDSRTTQDLLDMPTGSSTRGTRSFSPIYDAVLAPTATDSMNPEDETTVHLVKVSPAKPKSPTQATKSSNGAESASRSYALYKPSAAFSRPEKKKLAPPGTPPKLSAIEDKETDLQQKSPSRSPRKESPTKQPGSPERTTKPDSAHKTSPRSRVPGGAAAKLMLLGPKASDEGDSDLDADSRALLSKPSTDSISADYQEKALAEIDSAKARAKNEFVAGNGERRTFFQATDTIHENQAAGEADDKDGIVTDKKGNPLPSSSLFDRKESFHPNASAAVSALLTPRSNHGISDTLSVASSGVGGGASEVPSVFSAPSLSVTSSAFQMPRSMGGEGKEDGKFESLSRQDVNPKLITEDTEKRLEKLQESMRDPDKTLADLLTSIHTADGFVSDLGFTVRRKNACGALQVMTAQASNRVPIAWTVGVLPALTSVLRDTGEEGTQKTYPERRHRTEFEAARNRAIACLMNLSMPPQNRIAVFHTPELVQWLIVVMNEGQGIPRKGACAILAYLGKTVENRLLMVQVPGMVDALNKVLKPRPPRVERHEKIDRVDKKLEEYGSDDDESGDDGSAIRTLEEDTTMRSERSKNVSVHSSYSNDSAATPRFSGTNTPVEVRGYDDTVDEHLRAARQNIFALTLHLVKEKDNAYHLARHDALMTSLAAIANYHDSPSHLLAIKAVAFLTRHRLNTKILAFKQRYIVPAIVHGTSSMNDSSRLFCCYALQNLAQDKSCRQELAVAPGLISALCERSRKAQSEEERLAAISAIKNLCDEPANLIPMTNTPDCIATLMHLAHGMEEGITDLMQYRACDALATLSHWLRKIATSGQALENAKTKQPPPKTLFVPSLQVVPFNQWK